MTQKKKKTDKVTILLMLILLAGAGLLAYPSVADWWNSFHATRAIKNYTEQIEKMDTSEYDAMRAEAEAYNRKLLAMPATYTLNEAQMQEYMSTLSIDKSGMMGIISIPKIRVTLPIYHTTDESVLQIAVGHIPGTSLPVGGESTHCVLSGHRGLPSARLFTDIDKLKEGDIFMMQILNETLTYEIDQIRTVLPEEMKDIQIEEGKDYCTLVTCTPYGINTHRLLLRGHRVETTEVIHISADAVQINPYYAAAAIGGVILAVLLAVLFVRKRK